MAKKSKRYRSDAENLPEGPVPLGEAVKRVKGFKEVKFDQSVEICFHLGINPKQADQMLRGSLSLPHGIGQTKRVIAFCSDDKIESAKEAGALAAGGEELVTKIEGGWMEFDVAVAEPALMRIVSKLGRVLGPKGLMPSPKSGTVAPNVVEAIKEFTAGKVEYRSDQGGNVHAIIGKYSFPNEKLEENAQTFIDHMNRIKPSSVKGTYIKKIAVAATMTPAVEVAS